MDKSIKVEIIILCCVLVGTILLAAGIYIFNLDDHPDNALSKALVERSAERYLSENYADCDYTISSIAYNYEDERYHIMVSSDKSVDSWFVLECDSYGKRMHNAYKGHENTKAHTISRLSREYDTAIKAALPSIPDCSDIECFGYLNFSDVADPYATGEYILIDEIEFDGKYDPGELGAKAGHLRISVRVSNPEQVNGNKLAGVLLYIRQTLDWAGLPFCDVSCTLCCYKDSPGKYMQVNDFDYKDICEEGLVNRVNARAVGSFDNP